MDNLLSCFAPDPDLVLIGTGADEKGIGLNEVRSHLKRSWTQSEAASIEPGWTSVSAAGSVAWVAGDAIIHAMVNEGFSNMNARIVNKHIKVWVPLY